MLLARHADHQIPSSIRAKIDCTSSLATHAGPDEVLRLSRQVSRPRWVKGVDNKVKSVDGTRNSAMIPWFHIYRPSSYYPSMDFERHEYFRPVAAQAEEVNMEYVSWYGRGLRTCGLS